MPSFPGHSTFRGPKTLNVFKRLAAETNTDTLTETCFYLLANLKGFCASAYGAELHSESDRSLVMAIHDDCHPKRLDHHITEREL